MARSRKKKGEASANQFRRPLWPMHGVKKVKPPSVKLPGYVGSYPAQELQAARRTLIDCVRNSGGPVWGRLKEKLGILASGERLESTSEYHTVWIPEQLPSQWSAPLTLISIDRKGVSENTQGVSEDAAQVNGRPSRHESETAHSLTESSAESPIVVSDSDDVVGNCHDLNCSCEGCIGSIDVFGDSHRSDGRNLIIQLQGTKRRTEVVSRNGVKKMHTSTESEKSAACVGSKTSLPEQNKGSGFPFQESQNPCFTLQMRRHVEKWDIEAVESSRSMEDNMHTVTAGLSENMKIGAEPANSKMQIESSLKVRDGKKYLMMSDVKSMGKVMFKCDYCDFVEEKQVNLKKHLSQAEHYSGSKCVGQETPQYIMALSKVKYKPAFLKTAVPVCCTCEAVFETIDKCVQHSFFKHAVVGEYSLRTVLDRKNIFVTKSELCQVCKTEFSSFKELSNHWKTTQHVTITAPNGTMVLFTCPYCGRFSRGFNSIRQHVISHKKQSSSDLCGAVSAVYLCGPTGARHLPPLLQLSRSGSKKQVNGRTQTMEEGKSVSKKAQQSSQEGATGIVLQSDTVPVASSNNASVKRRRKKEKKKLQRKART